jgi:hypothetical protein
MRLAITLAILAGTLLAFAVHGCAHKEPDTAYVVTMYANDGTAIRSWQTYHPEGIRGGWYFKDILTGKWVRASGNIVFDEYPIKEMR